jgi:hypothetical protein
LYGLQKLFKMDEDEYLNLPEIVCLEDCGGDILNYIEVIYDIFKEDFVTNKPFFEGRRLGLKKYPYVEGKEYTFYHMTHDGNVEDERIPNLRRCERMPFPRPIIEQSNHSSVKCWKNKRGTKDRILIFYEQEDYLVVLEDRGDFILPWTAYLVGGSNQKKKLLREYSDYIKARAAQQN